MNLVSVILSTYNEPCLMISQSIDSIINQTYKNLEIILINDNPGRHELDELLNRYAEKEKRIRYIKHQNNKGLVASLNEGINLAKGEFIARMDADDISELQRLEKQLVFICEREYDIVGSCIVKIDENDTVIGELTLPSLHKHISRFMRYGSCVLHPTWFVRKRVYDALNGYRNIVACEDYDFLLRAINSGFKLGNIPDVGLRYRIRSNGISQSTYIRQMLTMHCLAASASKGTIMTKEEVEDYLNSNDYYKNVTRLEKYETMKRRLKNGEYMVAIEMITNKYFFVNLRAYLMQKVREYYVLK